MVMPSLLYQIFLMAFIITLFSIAQPEHADATFIASLDTADYYDLTFHFISADSVAADDRFRFQLHCIDAATATRLLLPSLR